MTDSQHSDDDTTSPTDVPNSKVARLIETYDLEPTGDALERRWTGEGTEQQSLRDLAGWFNQQLLAAVMDEADLQYLDGEVANIHRLLTADDVSRGMRTQARSRLADAGIDPDHLDREFVSHRAIHTYLTQYRGVEYQATSADESRRDHDARTVRRLQSRLATVTETTLTRLRQARELTLGEFDVLVDVRVHCRDCGTTHGITELFADAGCDCER